MTSTSGIAMFHKPKGVVVSRSDERGRTTVYDLLPARSRDASWVPVGRLDRDTRGLLLFVREGRLVELLTRPGACVKTYEVWVRGRVTDEHLARIASGVPTAGGVLTARRVERAGGAGPKTRLIVELDEGKNRQIRRLFGALADPERGTPLKVVDLKRTAIGTVRLDVPSGGWRELSAQEAGELLAAAGAPSSGRRP
jgi:23S rRNA pseudouridine2605 synthase